MKKTIYMIAAAALVLAACQKENASLKITPTSGIHTDPAWTTYIQGTGTVNEIHDDDYYEELREWKEAAYDEETGLAMRSISYVFFADYGSMAYRFADIPDSVDVINLWGGLPKLGSLDYMEMKACQEIKGMKLVGCRITQVMATDGQWAFDAEVPSFMDAYNKYIEDHEEDVEEGRMTNQQVIDNAISAAKSALKTDMSSHPNPVGDASDPDNYPEWCQYIGGLLIDEIDTYGLDGYDLDLEPNGDPLGNVTGTLIQYLSLFIGRGENAEPGTLLVLDQPGGTSYAEYSHLVNFFVVQTYSTTGAGSPAYDGMFPGNTTPKKGAYVNCQVIPCENVGDTYGEGCGSLEQYGNFVHSMTGKKFGHSGGFSSFYGHRDWRLPAEGAEKGKTLRYQHHRKAINAMAKHNYYQGD